MSYVIVAKQAAKDVYTTHKYTHTAKEAADATLAAGMDVDCGNFLFENLGKGYVIEICLNL